MDNDNFDISANTFVQFSFAGNGMLSNIDLQGRYTRIATSNPAFMIKMIGFSFSDNKLIYTGADKSFQANVLALVSHDGQTIERELRIKVYKNGNSISEAFGKVNSSGSLIYKAVSFSGTIELVNGDALEVMVCNANGTEAISVKDLKFTLASR